LNSHVNDESLSDFIPNLSLSNVSFKYDSDDTNQIVDNLSVEVRAGETVAIIGPSGSGKSTLVDLMLGLLEPNMGKILVSGVNPSIAASKWSGKIGYVPQNVFIFSISIKENIAFGLPIQDINYQRVEEVLKLVNLDNWIAELPLGIETVLIENGENISGGQRQRIGLARAMYSNPELLILDEPTSSLDQQNESEIVSELNSLKGRVTIIMIAHRISTIKNADKILYISQGKMIAMGDFESISNIVPNFNLNN